MAVLVSSPAVAQSFNELRLSGVVGEGYDGFVHIRTPGKSAQDVVNSVNAQRSQIYAKRAKEQGISANQVGSVYAKELFAKASKGIWFLNESGNWLKK